jgi:inosose dehydratase
MLESITMNRREFLSAMALAAVPALRAADEKTITFGFSLYGMKSLSIADALSTCAKIGYDAVEFAAMPGWPAEPKALSSDNRKELRKRLGDSRLQLPAIMENCPLDGDEKQHAAQLERLKAAAQLAHDLVPDSPPVIETILGGKPDQWETLRGNFADRLADWAKLADAAKVTICIKAHRMGAMNRPEHVRWLLDAVKSERVRAAYDWSHFEQRDMKMADTLKELIPVTRFVHIKDTIVEKGQAKFVLPGDGSTDYAALLGGIKQHGYAGCVCVEVSGMVSSKKEYDPVAAAKKCYEALSPAFAKAGIRRRD